MFVLSNCLARCALACALALPAGAVLAQAAQPRPPVSAFFDNAPFRSPLLSPNGRLLAVIVGAPGKRDALAVIDLADNKVHSTAIFADIDVGMVQWVNDKRLLFNTTNKQLVKSDREFGPGLYAANFDGSGFRQLAERRNNNRTAKPGSANNKLLPYHTYLRKQAGAQNSDSVYVDSAEFGVGNDIDTMNLLLLDTASGRARAVERPAQTRAWLLDAKGEPRLASALDGKFESLHYRDPASGAWRQLASFELFAPHKDSFEPLAFGADGILYVSANAGKDKRSVHSFDLASGKINPQPLVTLADYDFTGKLIFSDGKLLGFRATTDAESTMWFDPAMKAVQEQVDALLDSTVNLISLPSRPETPWVLVESYSDVQPTTIRMYNTSTKAFNLVGSTHPAIDPARMGRQEFVRYKARDGLEIPALITVPQGAKQTGLPMVVLVHGGPFVRGGSWGWDAEAQFLASRGYVVLEPEFRGSAGFGTRHFQKGFKQWGLAMQDDITDGTKWAIAKGLADPKRICIAGASYGGYAAMMGLVKEPALYRCGVNWVGVTDIALLLNGHWRFEDDMPQVFRKYGMQRLIGDPATSAEQFKATSPLEQAARITQPLLLAYGSADTRVPLIHGEKFNQAVRKTNQDVEWVVYEGEGHGWTLPQNRIDFWTRMEKFLDRHIGSTRGDTGAK